MDETTKDNELINCPKCGKGNQKNNNMCIYCGNALPINLPNQTETITTNQQVPTKQEQPNTQQNKRKKEQRS